ncbi:MAG: HU family DNA-binding protein [Rikenellaceae bacterium]
MNKRELVTLVAQESHYSRREVHDIVSKSFEVILERLQQGESVSLRRFGRFDHKHHKARKGYNPKTRKKIDVPEKISIRFTPTTKFNKAIQSRET